MIDLYTFPAPLEFLVGFEIEKEIVGGRKLVYSVCSTSSPGAPADSVKYYTQTIKEVGRPICVDLSPKGSDIYSAYYKDFQIAKTKIPFDDIVGIDAVREELIRKGSTDFSRAVVNVIKDPQRLEEILKGSGEHTKRFLNELEASFYEVLGETIIIVMEGLLGYSNDYSGLKSGKSITEESKKYVLQKATDFVVEFFGSFPPTEIEKCIRDYL